MMPDKSRCLKFLIFKRFARFSCKPLVIHQKTGRLTSTNLGEFSTSVDGLASRAGIQKTGKTVAMPDLCVVLFFEETLNFWFSERT
jgi:hypothetical protein